MKDTGKYVMGIITGVSLAVAAGAAGRSYQREGGSFAGLSVVSNAQGEPSLYAIKEDGSIWRNQYFKYYGLLLEQQADALVNGKNHTPEQAAESSEVMQTLERLLVEGRDSNWWYRLGEEWEPGHPNYGGPFTVEK